MMPRAGMAESSETYLLKYANQIQSWLGSVADGKDITVISSDEEDSDCV